MLTSFNIFGAGDNSAALAQDTTGEVDSKVGVVEVTKAGSSNGGVTDMEGEQIPQGDVASTSFAEDDGICKLCENAHCSSIIILSIVIVSCVVPICTLKVNDVSYDAKSFVKNLITQLTTGDGTILLAVMFITDEGKKYHTKFPHVLGCDVTFGTNAEKRPLFRASGKTMNNNNIPHINGFVPSQQRWLFDWIFEDGLPTLLDPDALRKTCIIMTDQDAQLVGTLLTKLRQKYNSVYGIALNRLCKWHKIDRNYKMSVHLAIKTDEDDRFVTTIIHWLYHFTNEIETEAQMWDSYHKLEEFVTSALNDSALSNNLVVNTSTFLRESFKPMLQLLCQCYYNEVFCGDVNENCFVESDNASLKKDPMKPHANSRLYVSAKNILDHTTRRIDKLMRQATKKARSQILPKPSDSDVDKIRHALSKDIVEHKREKVLQQFLASSGTFLHSPLHFTQLSSITLIRVLTKHFRLLFSD